jgi:hypothetical protein
MRPVDHVLEFEATAGNVVAVMSNTTGETLEILFGEVSVTTDATVANRYIRLALYDASGTFFMDMHAGAAVPASQTGVHIQYLQGIYRETSFIDTALQSPIPTKFTLQSGWSMRCSAFNGVAGDEFSGKFYTREVRE